MDYSPDDLRYSHMQYKRCGRSGLLLPRVSLGLWKNFGLEKPVEEQEKLLFHAFDRGITHFDLANNYGHPANGLAETNFGRALKDGLGSYRDELIISTKAGYDMWPGPYGVGGSRKYLISSLDQSLKRMGLEYVDIFYHHRQDPDTPLEETVSALSDIVRQGKALYVGISNYSPERAEKAIEMLRQNGTPCLIDQSRYNLLEPGIEAGLLGILEREGVGCICFSPLAQGALTGKYVNGIPSGSRASQSGNTVVERYLSETKTDKVRRLAEIAGEVGITLPQLALLWILRRSEVTSVLVGASSISQLDESLKVTELPALGEDVVTRIGDIIYSEG